MTSLRMTLRKHIMPESVMERHYLLVAAFRPRCATHRKLVGDDSTRSLPRNLR